MSVLQELAQDGWNHSLGETIVCAKSRPCLSKNGFIITCLEREVGQQKKFQLERRNKNHGYNCFHLLDLVHMY